jgi:tetratricopeptide (TPR) repeat protein
VLAASAVVVLVVAGVTTHRQAQHWETNERLLRHTLAVTTDNAKAESALASVLAIAGRAEDAIIHYRRALAITPDDVVAIHGLGVAHDALGQRSDAESQYRHALALAPDYWRAQNDLGVILLGRNDLIGALRSLTRAVQLRPDAPAATANLRLALGQVGIADPDAYVKGLVTWTKAVDADRRRGSGHEYETQLGTEVMGDHTDAMAACLHGVDDAAASLLEAYVRVDASGAFTAVIVLPPSDAAQCVRTKLLTTHAPAPPFAPFHARLPVVAAANLGPRTASR